MSQFCDVDAASDGPEVFSHGMADHSTRVSALDADGELFYTSRKAADWLVEAGRAKWIGPARIQMFSEAKELRGRSSAGFITLQIVAKKNRRKRGGKTGVHVRLPADRRPTRSSE